MGFITGRGPTLKFCSGSKCEFAWLEKTCPGQVNGSLFGLCPCTNWRSSKYTAFESLQSWIDRMVSTPMSSSVGMMKFPTEWKNQMFQSPPDIVFKEVGSVKISVIIFRRQTEARLGYQMAITCLLTHQCLKKLCPKIAQKRKLHSDV